jgi:hypothetical protein
MDDHKRHVKGYRRALDAEYREIEAAGGLTFRRAGSLIDGTRYPEAVDLCPWSPQWCG